jgi:membrane fusion protein, multidrug efflux system
MLRFNSIRLALLVAVFSVSACHRPESEPVKNADVVLQLANEDVIVLQSNAMSSGPVITGSIQPERKADLRAEIASVVLQVLKENGETVKRGDLLVRLDDTAIRDSLQSAEAAASAASLSLDQAERQLQRLKTLRTSGMASAQQLDDAETRRNNAQSEVAAAKTRAVQARQQLQRTEIRAPFDGVTSERKVSPGDTAQIGKELIKVIDPASMRLQGLISADKVGSVKVGQGVNFHVNGYGDQEFNGRIKRVNPAANSATRQVEVLVEFVGGDVPAVSGLYAEGRIEASSAPALLVKNSALVREGDKTYAWRVKDGVVHKVELQIGERDPRRGDYVVLGGLASGDMILRTPTINIKDGQKIDLAALNSSAASAPSIAPVNARP